MLPHLIDTQGGIAVKVSALLLFLCCVLPAVGQTNKIAVAFDCDCTDAVGSRYATAFRDLLAASPRYYMVQNAEEKDKNGKTVAYRWHLKVLSLDPAQNNNGQDSVISAVLLLGDGLYMTQSVQWCPLSQVNSCAASTMSFMDGFLNAK
jgi:hypothetical protein